MNEVKKILDQMRGAGLPCEQGTPATDADVAALQAAADHRFPEDYLAFLKAFGWLRAGRCIVFGLGPDNMGIDAASASIEMEFGIWGQPCANVRPLVSQSNLFPQDCLVVDAAGELQSFHRGQLTPRSHSFEEALLESLRHELDASLNEARKAAFRQELMSAIRDRIPSGLLHTGDGATDSLFLQRPGEGSPIEIRFGNGQEYGTQAPGVFVRWTTPQCKSLEAMNDFNRKALLVRGCVQEGFNDRYRGCLPADTSCVATLLNALAHDAGLPITIEDELEEPSLDQIAAALPPSPITPEQRLFMAMMGEEPKGADVRREGEALVLSVAGMRDSEVKYGFRIRPSGHGLVEVSHVLHAELTWSQINTLNGASTDPSARDRDQEHMVRAVKDGSVTVLSFVTTLAGIHSGAYKQCLASLLYRVEQGGDPDL